MPNYTLTAGTGSFTLTGIAATLFESEIIYRIYANDGLGGPIDYTTPVATTTTTTWTSSALSASKFYRYAVRAYNNVTGLEESNVDAHIDLVTDASYADVTHRPFAPTALVARNLPAVASNCHVRVDWSYPSLDRDHLPTGFHVYIGTPTVSYASAVATVLYTTAKQAYSAELTGLTDSTSYQVAVRAYNATGEEPNTRTYSITADATPPSSVDSLSGSATAIRGD